VSGSKLHPRMGYKTGKVETGGYLSKNDRPKSASSPDWRGMFYLEGYGWIFLSGWTRQGRGAQMIRLTSKDMSDPDAEKYCAPKDRSKTHAEPPPSHRPNGRDSTDSDDGGIPF